MKTVLNQGLWNTGQCSNHCSNLHLLLANVFTAFGYNEWQLKAVLKIQTSFSKHLLSSIFSRNVSKCKIINHLYPIHTLIKKMLNHQGEFLVTGLQKQLLIEWLGITNHVTSTWFLTFNMCTQGYNLYILSK